MDADIYGPSVPTMLGIRKPPEFSEDKLMIPLEVQGIITNSIGFLVDPSQAMIWRGPMASQALTQLLLQTQWGTEQNPLDILIVDLPPGTGDIQLTLTQKTIIDGAIIVSTPQEMALTDARRAITLFQKTNIKILGIIENMSFLKTSTGDLEIFGRGGAKNLATSANLSFLGEVPIEPALRASLDAGRPLTSEYPQGETARRFRDISQNLLDNLKNT
jgi:ATP-binding protein involved in chromosome partitioning